MESINENATSNQPAAKSTGNQLDPSNSNVLLQRKITSPNAYAAQLKIVNNMRMQRACRYSIRKIAINSIVETSNNQLLFTETTIGGGAGGLAGSGQPTGETRSAHGPTNMRMGGLNLTGGKNNGMTVGGAGAAGGANTKNRAAGLIPFSNFSIKL